MHGMMHPKPAGENADLGHNQWTLLIGTTLVSLTTVKFGLPKHRKSPQNTAIHRKSGSSDFKDVATDRKSV